jgi:site-specific recombinase XerD
MARARRVCLPCKDREEYVQKARLAGCTEIEARCKNRYADEFLRFCDENYGHHSARKVTAEQIEAYASHLCKTSRKLNTGRAKLIAIINWFRWLHEVGRLTNNPSDAMSPSAMLESVRNNT